MHGHLPLILTLLLSLFTTPASAQQPQIEANLPYNPNNTLDVIKPATPNGAGILCIQSGAWHSPRRKLAQLLPSVRGLLDKGYTVFIIWHSNPPAATVPDIVKDIRRASRYIHANAARWQVDPKRLAALGGSSAGHLSLMLATTGDDGDPASPDPIERASSRIATALVINPPSDLRGWTTTPPKAIAATAVLKAPLKFDASLEAANSPITQLDPADASILLIHGSADELVSVEQSKNLFAAMKAKNVPGDLLILEGGTHALQPEQAITALTKMLTWLDTHLAQVQ